jgi:hypothetical protein
MMQWRKPDGFSVDMSGTVIDDDIFRLPSFYNVVGDILWLYQYFALKGANDAVNVGMSHAGHPRWRSPPLESNHVQDGVLHPRACPTAVQR